MRLDGYFGESGTKEGYLNYFNEYANPTPTGIELETIAVLPRKFFFKSIKCIDPPAPELQPLSFP